MNDNLKQNFEYIYATCYYEHHDDYDNDDDNDYNNKIYNNNNKVVFICRKTMFLMNHRALSSSLMECIALSSYI